MSELDLTEAIEAGWQAIGGSRARPISLPDPASYAEARDWAEFEENEVAMVEAAVRAAAPIIERAVRERVAEEIAKAIEADKPSTRQFWDVADAARVYAANDFAKTARRIGATTDAA